MTALKVLTDYAYCRTLFYCPTTWLLNLVGRAIFFGAEYDWRNADLFFEAYLVNVDRCFWGVAIYANQRFSSHRQLNIKYDVSDWSFEEVQRFAFEKKDRWQTVVEVGHGHDPSSPGESYSWRLADRVVLIHNWKWSRWLERRVHVPTSNFRWFGSSKTVLGSSANQK